VKKLILLAVVGLLAVSACTYVPEPLPEGRCRVNKDCPQGTHCTAVGIELGQCEDIYYPRRKIKPF